MTAFLTVSTLSLLHTAQLKQALACLMNVPLEIELALLRSHSTQSVAWTLP
jgi:hypothetical protein